MTREPGWSVAEMILGKMELATQKLALGSANSVCEL